MAGWPFTITKLHAYEAHLVSEGIFVATPRALRNTAVPGHTFGACTFRFSNVYAANAARMLERKLGQSGKYGQYGGASPNMADI